MKINAIICIGILFMFFPSCQKNDRQLITQPQKQTVELRQIPVEEALATLTEFLQENKGDLRDTRSGRPREWKDCQTVTSQRPALIRQRLKNTITPLRNLLQATLTAGISG